MLDAFLGIFVLVAAVVLSLPVIGLVLFIVITRRSLGALLDVAPMRRFRERRKARTLRRRLKRVRAAHPNPTPDEFARSVRVELEGEARALNSLVLDDFVARARLLAVGVVIAAWGAIRWTMRGR